MGKEEILIVLRQRPNSRAGAIAEQLGAETREVNRLLYKMETEGLVLHNALLNTWSCCAEGGALHGEYASHGGKVDPAGPAIRGLTIPDMIVLVLRRRPHRGSGEIAEELGVETRELHRLLYRMKTDGLVLHNASANTWSPCIDRHEPHRSAESPRSNVVHDGRQLEH